MSFIKVTDPRKREALIKDFIETRKRIKDNFVARKVGETEYQRGLTKLFKPVTETQKATCTAKEITEAQKTATKEITDVQKATAKEITDAQKAFLEKFTSEPLPIEEDLEKPPAIIASEPIKEQIINIAPIASNALENFVSKKGMDKTFGIKKKEGKLHMGDKLLNFEDDDIIIDGEVFEGTPGLWELITLQEPINYTNEDLKNYENLLIKTNAIFKDNNPNQNKAEGNYRGNKWKRFIEPIWEDIKPKPTGKGGKGGKGKGGRKKRQEDPIPSKSGTGLTILPNDPNALIERFDLLLASQNAGHTGVRNELSKYIR